jgi:oligopeptide/dipeptide ABC transporter ATP-binding protein
MTAPSQASVAESQTIDVRPAISVEHLVKRFRLRSSAQDVLAIDDVSFDVPAGSTLGIVGESGSGKSTLARCILGLIPFDSGRVRILDTSIAGARDSQLREMRAKAQIVFQEPLESLDPRLRIGEAIAEPLKIRHRTRRGAHAERVAELLQLVALDPALADRFPHQLSGGQQQRINIARALATNPSVLVLDEPTSSLDVSVRSEVLRLLAKIQNELGLTYVLISHDLGTIRAMATDIAVMYLGRIVEHGPAERVLERADHPYTRFLLGSELSLDPNIRPSQPAVREGVTAATTTNGCSFALRCPNHVAKCSEVVPALLPTRESTRVACHLVETAAPATGDESGVHAGDKRVLA